MCGYLVHLHSKATVFTNPNYINKGSKTVTIVNIPLKTSLPSHVCDSAWQMAEALCQRSGIFVFLLHIFFSCLASPVWYFGGMLRARLCQIEDRKRVKEKEVSNQIAQCNSV